MSEDDVYAFPRHWARHDHPHDYLACSRCLREDRHVEEHAGCDCLSEDWARVDIGTPAAPEVVWVCSECLRVAGPAWVGGVP